ncbi:hypothetical protein AT251_24085 [Enterovibrio nigricans]|nr:hypothetical protein [Enterovibrio nigricans]PKF48719.1 hypothetical protein AT251_24085 [Enterovibrio nigricans]
MILGGGEGQAKFHCGDEWILSGNDSQNYTLSAYTTLSKVLQLHQSNFGIDLFNTQAKLRHSHTQLIANSSYLPKDDSFIIYTADVGFYGSAYVDITTMAHEAGHKDTAFLLRNEDGSLFYEALKEGIADLYAVTLHNLYRAENGENTISWLIVLNQTDQRSSRALRSLNNPSNDYPASGNKHASEESKDKTPYQQRR